MQLTEEQQQIVKHRDGHAKVSAVAGSGKTTTMVARVRHLLAQGVAPEQLLVLMFNKSARDSFAAAMREVLRHDGRQSPEVRTFHSLGQRLVESFTRRGVLPARTLVTDEYRQEKLAKAAVRRIIDRDGGSGEWLAGEYLEGFLTFIDLVKADTVPAAELFASLGLDQRFAYFLDACEIFETERRAAGLRFYADLIHEPVMAMRESPELAAWVGNRVDHIIVDEYQDINEVQQQLLKFIAGSRAEVMVVGDVDQCIYEWRGAKPEYITERFQHDFPQPATYTLSFTFRFGHRLSLAANHLISRNRLRDRKLCLSSPANPDTELCCLAEKEPHPLLAILRGLAESGRSAADAAVLVRLFAMSVPVELALLEARIPYLLLGHEPVFACPEIRALTGYLRLCQGTLAEPDPEPRRDIIAAMLAHPHLGVKTEKIRELAGAIARRPEKAADQLLAAVRPDTPPFQRKRLEQTAQAWHDIARLSARAKAGKLLETIIKKTDLFDYYHKITSRLATAENRIKTCQAFVRFAQRLDLAAGPFLEKIDELQRQGPAPADDSLLITSIHRAKGLEWPVVIIPGLSDGSFPLLADERGEAFDNLEDERRLFYVAMTRAREKICFIHPPDERLTRQTKAGNSRYPRQPEGGEEFPASRFLYEANIDLSSRLGAAIQEGASYAGKSIIAQDIEVANRYLAAVNSPLAAVKKPASHPSRSRRGKTEILQIHDLAEGLLVRHPVFGQGVITAVLDRRTGKIRVLFDYHGAKTLIAEIARLQPR